MDMGISVAILVEGMRCGSFNGRGLDVYFTPGREDGTGARRIINGTDRAELVAGYGRVFARGAERGVTVLLRRSRMWSCRPPRRGCGRQ